MEGKGKREMKVSCYMVVKRGKFIKVVQKYHSFLGFKKRD